MAKCITGTGTNGEDSTKEVKLNIQSVKSKPTPLDDENIIPTSGTQKTQNLPPTAPEVIQPTVVHTATPNVASNNTGVVEISTGGGGNSPQSSLTSFTEAGSTIRGSIETIVTTEHPNQPPNTTTTLQLPPQQPNEIQQSAQDATEFHNEEINRPVPANSVYHGVFVDSVHDVNWYVNQANTMTEINGITQEREFVIKNIPSDRITSGSNISTVFLSPLVLLDDVPTDRT